jgi:hypothetical protein
VTGPLPLIFWELARSSKGGRYRKSAKIDALRGCKDEILEAHRSGISIHRIAQIFRERNVDISTQHLMRAIRLFIAEEEGTKGKASVAEGTGTSEKAPQESVTYRVPELPSALVREEEFTKQLRLARYLAASSLPPSRPLEPVAEARGPKPARPVTKARSRAKKEPARQKAGEAELAKERRRAGRRVHKLPSVGPGRGDKQRSSPGR